MANKNFIVKNGLEVGGQEVVSSSGVVTSAALGGQTLSTTDSPTFADLTLTGNLNLTGDINSYNVTDLDVTDQTITLGAGQLEALSGGSGIIVDGSSASILWDETNDEWDFNKSINVTGTVTADGLTVDDVISIDTSTGAAFSSTGNLKIDIDSDDSQTDRTFQITSDGNSKTLFQAEEGGDISFYEDTGTTAKLFWDASAESLGIGTTSPALQSGGTGLHVNGSSYSEIKFTNSSTGTAATDGTALVTNSLDFGINNRETGKLTFGTSNSTRMTIDSSGNVGIGGDPDSSGRLLVQNGGTNQIVLTNNDSATTNLNMGNFSGGAYISQNYYFDSGHQADDNTKGAFEIFIGDDSYGINYHSAGAMGIRRRDFAITSAGKVGIGMNSPSANLEIAQSGNNVGLLVAGGGYNYTAKFESSDAEANIIIEDSNSTNDGNMIGVATNDMYFITNTAERMRIDAEGNISFGTQKVDPNWSQFFNAISGNYGGHLSFQNNNYAVTALGNNYYINNSTLNERVLAQPTQVFKLDNLGNFLFESAASGTAGATFSFTEKMRINVSGNVGIGISSPTARLHIYDGANATEATAQLKIEGAGYVGHHFLDGSAYHIGQNSAGRALRLYSSAETAGVALAPGATSFGTFSDERLKENIQDIGSVAEKIKDIRCVTYNRKDVDDENKHDTIGFIAQDFVGKFDQVLDESKVLDTDEETRYSIRYTETIPILMKAIQEQQTIIDDLKSRLDEAGL